MGKLDTIQNLLIVVAARCAPEGEFPAGQLLEPIVGIRKVFLDLFGLQVELVLVF